MNLNNLIYIRERVSFVYHVIVRGKYLREGKNRDYSEYVWRRFDDSLF